MPISIKTKSTMLAALMAALGCSGGDIRPKDAGPIDTGAEDANSNPQDGGANDDASDGALAQAGTVIDGSTANDGACSLVLQEWAAGEGPHADPCTALTFASNPPAFGNHYGVWPAFKIYDKPVPWGYLVHGLEHGVVVISYNCPDGCAEELAAAKAFVGSLPKKAGCDTASVILTPDPKLDVRFAASAWNDKKAYTLRAGCFDAAAFGGFYNSYVDRNYESTCGGADWSSNGWCPAGVTPPCGPGC